jgi:hypothetical protein
MKKYHHFYLAIALCLIFISLAACVDEPISTPLPPTPTEQPELDLSGSWQVDEIGFDQSVSRTFIVEIQQERDALKILRDGKEIVSCTINGEALNCTNWEAYGLSVIYIDSPTTMHSELPLAESVNKLDFLKLE